MAQRLARVEALLQAAESESAHAPETPDFLRPFDVNFPRTDATDDPETPLSPSSIASSQGQSLTRMLNQTARKEIVTVTNIASPTDTVGRLVPESSPIQAAASNRAASIPRMEYAQTNVLPLQSMNMISDPQIRLPIQTGGILEIDPPPPDYHTDPSQASTSSPGEKQEVNSISSCESSNWEYHGPRSFLTICSKPGIQWVSQRAGTSTFQESAGTLTRDVTRRLKIEKKLSKERTLEPPAALAWKYSQSYFEGAPDAVFGVVDKDWFNHRLQTQLENPSVDEDPAWYALRNAIYAAGCRLELSKRGNFREAYQTAWNFFENALAVHTELLYFHTSLLAVQALTVMAYYTECIGSPCLEYMLVTNAARLAYSKGLHRQPVSSWDMSPSDQCHRSWLFWAIYCLEKNSCSRAGRPSAINDDEISCEISTVAPTSFAAGIGYPTSLIRLAQISTRVTRMFSNVQNMEPSPEVLADTVSKMHSLHFEMEEILQDLANPDIPLDSVELPAYMSLQQACFLRFTYLNITFEIHTALTNPWSPLRQYPTMQIQAQKSAEIVARSARAAILCSHFIRIDASTPVLLAFQGPMYALINLFIHILQNPELPTINSDLALMDIGAAHFARLEFATDSVVPIVFAKDVAALARTAVKNSKTFAPPHSSQSTMYSESGILPEKNSLGPGTAGYDGIGTPMNDNYSSNVFDFELDHWTTFLPLEGF